MRESLRHTLRGSSVPTSFRARASRASLIAGAAALAIGLPGVANAQDLASFAVLAGTTVTNTGPTVIEGNVGVSPGSAITGLGTTASPGIVEGSIHSNDQIAIDAKIALVTRYNELSAEPFTQNLTGQDLGGQTLTAGVYAFDTGAMLTTLQGPLVLDGQGNPNAVFIFQIGTTLTTGSASSIQLINGAQGGNVFFVVGSSATLGTTTEFEGHILALAAITLDTGANINCGAAWAQNAAVTLDTNNITICELEEATFGDVVGPDASDNEDAVADAIDDFVTGGGTLAPGFEDLIDFLSPQELADALEQLGGEVATGVAPSAIGAMDSFLNLVVGGRTGAGMPIAPGLAQGSDSGIVRSMGYAPSPVEATDLTFSAFDRELPQSPTSTVWAAGYGGYSVAQGDEAVGSHQRTGRSYGIAAGVDFHLDAYSTIGLAVAKGGTSFAIADDLGTGSSDVLQAAIHARTEFDAAYVAAAFGYGYSDVTTERTVTVNGSDRYGANFSAHNMAGHVEAGYRLGNFTPYAAARGHTLAMPAYAETTEGGNATYALQYDARNATALRTELGGRVDWSTPLDDGSLSLYARAAWARDFATDNEVLAAFQAMPDSEFTIDGAAADRDAALLSVGAELAVGAFSVAGSLDAELARNTQSYTGALKLAYTW